MMNAAYLQAGAVGSIGLDRNPSMPPGVEVGQVQIALATLNDAIERACDGQQSIEIRLAPVMLCLPEGKSESGATQPAPAVCELVEAIQRMQSKVEYLGSRQKQVLQSVQL